MDKEKIKKILLIVISALTLAALALLLVIIVVSIAPGGIKGFEDYTVTAKDINTGSLILADDNHEYSYTFADDELVLCRDYRDSNLPKDENGKQINKYLLTSTGAMQLSKDAMAAAHDMLFAAEAAVGQKSLCIDETYGYYTNKNGAINEYKTARLIYLAYMVDTSSNVPNEKLSPEYSNWLDANAASYGFIESFEDGYRYVGVVHATYMKANSKTLAQYIDYLKTNTSNEKPLKASANGVEYQIYYVACKAGDTIKVPSKNEYTISGTNEGGVIITVKVSK